MLEFARRSRRAAVLLTTCGLAAALAAAPSGASAAPPGCPFTVPDCIHKAEDAIGNPQGDWSGTCTGGTVVQDGYVGGQYVKLRYQQAPGDPETTWVCYRVADSQPLSFGGRLDITVHGTVMPQLIDDNTPACTQTLLGGQLGSDPWRVAYEPSDGRVAVCLEYGGTLAARALVQLPSGPPSVVAREDNPSPPMP